MSALLRVWLMDSFTAFEVLSMVLHVFAALTVFAR